MPKKLHTVDTGRKLVGQTNTITMKANELRIGNWVEATNNNVKFPYVITAKELEYFEADNNRFEPIPLTGEQLLKFEHTRTTSNKYQRFTEGLLFQIKLEYFPTGDWFVTVVQNINGGFAEVVVCRVRYIHEYQNVYYALTNTELLSL